MIEWTGTARRLAEELTRSGELRSPHWRDAICAVPRHELVPHFYSQNEDATWLRVDSDTTGPDRWLDTVYSDTTLITALADAPHDWGTGQVAVSSSTMPGLMISMLEALHVRDGDRVLEIGTGTGYNAALLSHRVGSGNVFSIDMDPELVELARQRLAALGYTPTLITRDGDQGLAEHAPFDRIISTCAVPAIPRAWIEQTPQHGLILTDFKPSGLGGNLVLLERSGDTATGRFLPSWAGFMTMRHAHTPPKPHQPRRVHTHARTRHTTAPPQPWMHPVPWFLAQFGMPDGLTFGQRINDTTGEPDTTYLSATDGSWCEISTEQDSVTRDVTESGPVSLWDVFEHAYEHWQAAGEPDWERLGLTVTPNAHTVWLDEPDSTTTWRLA
ncbi:MAG: ATP-grasp peptide maturase system methyltransferase [Pseudonocardiaceae bacterium]